MGYCNFCGDKAGFFKKQHEECLAKYEKTKLSIPEKICQAIITKSLNSTFVESLEKEAMTNYLKGWEYELLLLSGWEKSIDKFLDDNLLSKEEEAILMETKETMRFEQEFLDKHGYFSKIAKSAILRDITNGVIESRVKLKNIPIIFKDDETILWPFLNVDYIEEKTRREYVGRSNGVSVRIAKGLYYRTSAFKGHPIDRTYSVLIDTGFLVITNKNVYFSGQKKSLRIPNNKILSLNPFSDGISIEKDAANSKRMFFKIDDPWFAYNLISNICSLD